MGYQRGSDRFSNRWREDQDRGYGRGDYGRDNQGREDERGFIDRAGDEVRSWFGDEEAERRRERDTRDYQQDRGITGYRSNDWDDDQRDEWRGQTAGGGWGNQQPGGFQPAGSGFGGSQFGGRSDRDRHDPHYSEWRNRQIEALDRDYDEYRREHQSKFDQEFGSWREKRQGQRQSLGKATEHMEVVGSDGQHIGKVDKIRGDRIILAKNDPSSGGIHHSIPCSWIDKVEDKVTINKTAEQAFREWKDEERSRALFEREDQGSDGPHVLDRSFSGTYK